MQALNGFPEGLQLFPLTQMAKTKTSHPVRRQGEACCQWKWKDCFSGLESSVK